MDSKLSRRTFLVAGGAVGGGLLVGCSRGGEVSPLAAGAKPGEVALNAWLKIGPEGTCTIAVPRQEMGQGCYTGLAQLVADEIDADWDSVRVEQAPIDGVYANRTMFLDALPFDEHDDGMVANGARWAMTQFAEILGVQLTGGSTSLRDAWGPMRHAGASARAMLVKAAARRLGVPEAELATEKGTVMHAKSGQRLSYGELASAAAQVPPPSEPRLKRPDQFKLIGQDVARVDIPAKTNGTAPYGIDARPEGIIYAAIAMSPTQGGTVLGFDDAAARAMKGVIEVVPVADDAVAVVAEHYWQARKAVDALAIDWDAGPHAALNDAEIEGWLKAGLDSDDALGYREDGDAAGKLGRAARVVEATYQVPFLAHATMEPHNCTVRFDGDGAEVWCGSQGPTVAQWEASNVLDLAMDDVIVHTPYLGGGFGGRAELTVLRQAARIAMAVPRRPVQLIWSREDDMRHDAYRPAAMARLRAGLDAQGNISGWHARHASPSVSKSFMGRVLPWVASDGPDNSNVDGSADLPYAVADILVDHVATDTPVPVGFWRSVGHSQNAFFTESFVDEVAHAAGRDPFAFRRTLLRGKPRFLTVLETAAAKAGWTEPLPEGRARGIAIQKSFGSIVAQVAEVSVDGEAVKVERVVCVIDCGTVVSPDIVKAQMEGGIVYGLSALLYGEINVERGEIVQGNFPDYEMVRLATAPRIEVHIIADGHAPGGVGEPGTPPVAPAVTNAIFAATGKRIRQLPLARSGIAIG
ncbi:MAG: xanthine dehydrogenase family protein molybdopterin-binding subunit [Alphaproteobacteria bacterium]